MNTRGKKSKLVSIKRILLELKPQVICITETHLEQNEKIDIEGSELYYNSNKKGGINWTEENIDAAKYNNNMAITKKSLDTFL